MKTGILFLILPLSTTKNPVHIGNEHKKTLKGEEKTDCLGTLATGNSSGEFSGFSFHVIYPTLRAKEAGHPGRATDTDKNPNISMLSPAKG